MPRMHLFYYKHFILKTMKMNRNLFVSVCMLLTAALCVVSCSKDDDEDGGSSEANVNRNDVSQEPLLGRLEFPSVKRGTSMVIIHKTSDAYSKGVNYAVEWDSEKKSSRWTCYQMIYKDNMKFTGGAGRANEFKEDPDLPQSLRLADTNAAYKGSGFTRGHICPSADRQYSVAANAQTYYFTNIQPQYYNFNAGDNYTSAWVRLENKVRDWAKVSTTDTLYVVKGGTIEDSQLLMKVKDELRVPKYFFVALLAKNKQGYKAIGFWMEHKSTAYTGQESLGSYAVNIHSLEARTGIDFFCNLPDKTEKEVEELPVENCRKAWGI